MQNINNFQSIVPASYDYLYDSVADKIFAEFIVRYILFDNKPTITPALWQDVAIFIRYKKRDVWTLKNEQLDNARYAILVYQVKYIIEHLKKPEILKILNQFFTQSVEKHKRLIELFEQKFHTTIDSLLFTQEKLTIDGKMAQDFDRIFEYPCWPEFTDEANQVVFDKILHNKLSDEQIDYFLGASDTIAHYDQWFAVVKHILNTTHDSHVFYTAGDILSIIWKAIPQDEKSQKWFRDQIFEIFWPRVGNIWPLLNEDKIDFEKDEKTKILRESIGWLQVLKDLKERLPELGEDYKTYEHDTDEAGFAYYRRTLLIKMEKSTNSLDEIMELFFNTADCAYDDKTVTELKRIADDQLIPLVKKTLESPTDAIKLIRRAIKHAETYAKNLAHERTNLARNLISFSA